MTAVIFGASGQDGYYLSEFLKEKGFAIIALSRNSGFNTTDISSFDQVCRLVKEQKPDYIFHLAANSTTNHSVFFENQSTIVTGTINLLEAVSLFYPLTRVFISSSGLMFKNDNRPIKETDPFDARDAYSLCRIQSVYAARYYRLQGIKVYTGYFFNHDSPLRSERHMTKRIAETAKRIGKGSFEKMKIGDINAIKEYTFAGDVVKGIWTLVNQDKIFEANISSGKGYSIKEWLEQCFSLVNKNWHDHITPDAEFVPEYKQLVSDPSLIFSLGWRPEMSFEDLARLMMKE